MLPSAAGHIAHAAGVVRLACRGTRAELRSGRQPGQGAAPRAAPPTEVSAIPNALQIEVWTSLVARLAKFITRVGSSGH